MVYFKIIYREKQHLLVCVYKFRFKHKIAPFRLLYHISFLNRSILFLIRSLNTKQGMPLAQWHPLVFRQNSMFFQLNPLITLSKFVLSGNLLDWQAETILSLTEQKFLVAVEVLLGVQSVSLCFDWSLFFAPQLQLFDHFANTYGS